MGGWKSDETTDAVAEYLLKFQNDLDHWKPQTVRPPSEGSLFTVSYVALRGLKMFGTTGQQERISQRAAQVRQWMLNTPAGETENRVFRLLQECLVGNGVGTALLDEIIQQLGHLRVKPWVRR